MGRVHRVEAEAIDGAIEIRGADEVLDGLEDLLENAALEKFGFEHLCRSETVRRLLTMTRCAHRRKTSISIHSDFRFKH